MSDPKWDDIYSHRAEWKGGLRLPSVGRLDVPRIANPTCPDHCGGRHETDGVLMCPSCLVPKYRVVLHSWFHQDGHYWNEMVPMNGAPPYDPTARPTCPCGRQLERRFA